MRQYNVNRLITGVTTDNSQYYAEELMPFLPNNVYLGLVEK